MKPGFNERGKCLGCKNGIAMERTNTQTGEMFLGCSNYPNCKNSSPYPEELNVPQPTPTKKKATKSSSPDGLSYEARLSKKRFRFR